MMTTEPQEPESSTQEEDHLLNEDSPSIDTATVLELFRRFEERQNAQEHISSQLLTAYMEVWAALSLVLTTTVQERSPEDQEKFMNQFQALRNEVYRSVQEASRSGVEGLDENLTTTLADMASRFDRQPSNE